MKTPDTSCNEVVSRRSTQLLDRVRAIRASVGDSLNEIEFTQLVKRLTLPAEAGFEFLNFSGGFVLLAVPQQDPANWYPEQGWIVAEKEQIARKIADKHELSFCEPPDTTPSSLFPGTEPPELHHHLELNNRWETVVVAHPYYLKVRLFGATSAILYARTAQSPLNLRAELLHDLSALYRD